MRNFQLCRVIAVVLLLLVTVLLYQENESTYDYRASFRLEASTRDLALRSQKPFFESQIIPQPAYLPAAHSSSFVMLPNKSLLAFWFSGTREGSPDVKIWSSTYQDGTWKMASSLVDPQMISKANHRYVVKVGNPVIYLARNGELHLFVVSVSVGGWSGSNLNHLISTDRGKTWSKPERIVISPFFNISTLVRTSAVSLTDGGFYLPVYHEFIRKYPELLRFDANGKFIEQIRISNKNRMLQPSIMPINSDTAYAYFRNSSLDDSPKNIFMSETTDGGRHWSALKATNLTNHDASVVAANLNDGRYIMVYNEKTRGHLWLAISSDGMNWKPFYQLENVEGDEFSYPDVQVNGDIVDIMYTNNRKNIKHVRFNREWLNGKIRND